MQSQTHRAILDTEPPPLPSIHDIVAAAIAGSTSLIQAAVACFHTGLTCEQCAPELYAQITPKPSLNDFANTLAAVWWAPITAGTQSLTNALTSCNAFLPAAIAAAVAAAMAQYKDVLVRKALDDTGAIPYTGGSITASPDIITGGTTQNPDPATAFGAATYGSDPSVGVPAQTLNFIYLRGKNLFPESEPPTDTTPKPRFMAYSTEGSLAFNSANWVPLTNTNGTPFVEVSAAEGAVVVGATPFQWTPPDPTMHYCLIGRTVTDFVPDPLPDTSTINNQLEWLRTRPGYCWKNITFIAPDQFGAIESTLNYGNADAEPWMFALVIDARNLAGATVSVTAEDSDLRLDPVTIGSNAQQVTTFVTLPGKFEGKLHFRAHSPAGKAVMNESSIELRYYAMLPPHHPGARFTETFATAGIEPHLMTGQVAETAPAFLGNFVFRCA